MRGQLYFNPAKNTTVAVEFITILISFLFFMTKKPIISNVSFIVNTNIPISLLAHFKDFFPGRRHSFLQ